MTDAASPSADTGETIEALCDAFALKDEARTGWELRGVENPESVAAHSWGVAYLVITIGELFVDECPGVDLDAALRMAVIHDLGEATIGDIPTRADTTATDTPPSVATDTPSSGAKQDAAEHDGSEQNAAEHDAITELTAPFAAANRLRAEWETYEQRACPEARIVKDLDVLELCLQALVYERGDRYDPTDDAGEPDAFTEYDALDEFFETARRSISTETGRDIFARIHERYVAARDGESAV